MVCGWLIWDSVMDYVWLMFPLALMTTTEGGVPAASGRRRRLAGALTRSCISSPRRPALAAVGVGASGVPWPHLRRRRPPPRGTRPRPVDPRDATWPPPPPTGCCSWYLVAVGPLIGNDGHGGNGRFGARWTGVTATSRVKSTSSALGQSTAALGSEHGDPRSSFTMPPVWMPSGRCGVDRAADAFPWRTVGRGGTERLGLLIHGMASRARKMVTAVLRLLPRPLFPPAPVRGGPVAFLW